MMDHDDQYDIHGDHGVLDVGTKSTLQSIGL